MTCKLRWTWHISCWRKSMIRLLVHVLHVTLYYYDKLAKVSWHCLSGNQFKYRKMRISLGFPGQGSHEWSFGVNIWKWGIDMVSECSYTFCRWMQYLQHVNENHPDCTPSQVHDMFNAFFLQIAMQLTFFFSVFTTTSSVTQNTFLPPKMASSSVHSLTTHYSDSIER